MVSIELPVESRVKAREAMKRHIVRHVRGGTDAMPYPLNDRDFMRALAKIQLAIDAETL